MSGALGSMIIKSCPAELAKLLKMGEYIGVGKGTTMGLGDYRLESIEK
jgi:CRISPR/Cas system endoribonuclease Cas6 (RAMP superfamily)